MKQDIAGTTMFDGDQAQKGFALNRMCFSFNRPENRAAFLKDEDGYCRKFGLNEQQRAAIKARNVLKLIEAGGNVYYLAKFAGIFGLNVRQAADLRCRRCQGIPQRGCDPGPPQLPHPDLEHGGGNDRAESARSAA